MISPLTEATQPTTRWFRIVAAIVLVGLSLALAYGGAHWSVASSLWDVPFDVGFPRRCDHGVIKNGELWFVSAKRSGNDFVDTYRIKRLDLQTGIAFETEIENAPRFCRKLLWIGSRLYACTARAIYRTDGASMATVATFVPEPLLANWFECDGFLTNVSKSPEGEIRLIQLIDGEWVSGRRMILPRGDVVWYDDPQSGHKIFQLGPVLEPDNAPQLFVVTYQQQQHVLFTNSMISAYRAGFEFVDEKAESASALVPENAPDVTGWEPVNAAHFDAAFTAEPWRQFAHDRDGWLFKSDRYPNRIVRRDQKAGCEELVGDRETMTWTTRMLNDSTTDTNYIIDEHSFWGGATIRRIEGNTIQPVHLVVNGYEQAYLRRWLLLVAGLACTWLTHLIVIGCGTTWLLRSSPPVRIQSGARQALLVPVWRRAGALAVDVILLLLILATVHHLQFRKYYPGRLAGFPAELDDLLYYHVEGSLPDALTDHRMFADLMEEATRLVPITPNLTVQLFVLSVALFMVKSLLEGRYGFTPGKWIFGIRTTRSLLRPCGFARALVRNVLYFVDFPFLLTPIPGAVSMIFSDKRQRLGDRVADTIVIRAGSVVDEPSVAVN